MKAIHSFPRSLLLILIFSATAFLPKAALAHAVLLASTPTARTTVKGPEIAVQLKFNSRIDGAHSRLYLVDSNGKIETLTIVPQDSPDALAAQSVKVSAGGYTIRWQALASDGHITRGEIPFMVQ